MILFKTDYRIEERIFVSFLRQTLAPSWASSAGLNLERSLSLSIFSLNLLPDGDKRSPFYKETNKV